jgi:hypothetical protein
MPSCYLLFMTLMTGQACRGPHEMSCAGANNMVVWTDPSPEVPHWYVDLVHLGEALRWCTAVIGDALVSSRALVTTLAIDMVLLAMCTVIVRVIARLRPITVPALIPTAVRVAESRGRRSSDGGANMAAEIPPAAGAITTKAWIVPWLPNAAGTHTRDLI